MYSNIHGHVRVVGNPWEVVIGQDYPEENLVSQKTIKSLLTRQNVVGVRSASRLT